MDRKNLDGSVKECPTEKDYYWNSQLYLEYSRLVKPKFPHISWEQYRNSGGIAWGVSV